MNSFITSTQDVKSTSGIGLTVCKDILLLTPYTVKNKTVENTRQLNISIIYLREDYNYMALTFKHIEKIIPILEILLPGMNGILMIL